MGSAYVVPTPEASLTVTAGRALQGLGCGACQRMRMNAYGPASRLIESQGGPIAMNYYFREAPAPGALNYYMRETPRPGSLLNGYALPPLLSGLGAGPASRFNRAVARGVYTDPFISQPFGGNRGLGDLTVDPTMLFLGIGLLAGAMFFFGGKTLPKIRRHRAGRIRRKIGRYQARLRELEA